MGRDERSNPLIKQLKEAMASRNVWGVYDEHGREVKVGDLVRLPSLFNGSWLVQEIRPAMEREFAVEGKRLVHVTVVVQQHFVMEAGARAPGLLQAFSGVIPEQDQDQGKGDEEEKEPAPAPSSVILP